jgi:PAS domain S-box-containing protein
MEQATTAAGRRWFHKPRHGLWSWINDHTLGASWLPARLRGPGAGVLLGLAVIGGIFIAVPLLRPEIDGVPLGLLLLFMAIVLTAIIWGTGPALVVTILGMVILDHIQWYPHPALAPESGALTLEDIFILVIGVLIGYLAGENVATRRHVEQMRRRSEEERQRLDTVLEVMPAGMALSDREGNFLRYNSHFKQLWGGDAPLVKLADYGRFQARWPDTGLPISMDQLALSRALRQGTVSGEEIEIFTFDGQYKTILNAAAPVRDIDGEIVGGVVAETDITEPKRREQQVREALHALLTLAEALIGPKEAPQRPDDEGTAPESLAMGRYAQLLQDIFACREVLVGTIDPATDQYTLIAAAGFSAEEERRQKALLQGVALGDYLSAEERADFASGSSIVVNRTLSARVARDVRMPPAASAVVAPLRWQGRLIGLLSLRYLENHPPFGQETKGLVEASARLAELILERERIVAQREEARATAVGLEETTKQMDAFLGMATHELKSPLTTILLALQLSRRHLEGLRRQVADCAPEASEQLETMVDDHLRLVSQGKKLDRLVNDLLDMSRFQAGKLQVQPERMDLRPLVQHVVKEQQDVASTRTIRLHLPHTDESIMVQADPDRIGQVILNYLTNALKYSPADAPVEVGLELTVPMARVWVRDQGPGLPEAEQERIWQRYHRVPGIEVQSGTGIGLGLGLSIARHIIELHGGVVGVESTPGQGSTFWFTLPLSETASLSETAHGA